MLQASLENETVSWGILPDDDVQRELEETKQQASDLLQHVIKSNELERRRLQHVFDSLQEAVLVVDGTGTINSYNKAALKLLGQELTTTRTLSDFFPEYPNDLLVETRLKYRKFCNCDPRTAPEVYERYVKDNNTILASPSTARYARNTVEITLNVLAVGEDEETFSFLVTIKDLTPHVCSNRELSRYRSSLFGLLSIIPVPTFYKDSDLRFSAANPSFGQLMGLSASDIIGKNNRDLFSEDTAIELDALDEAALASASVQHRTLDLKFLNGLIRNARVYGKSINDGTRVTGTAGSILVDSGEQLRNKLFQIAAKSIVFFDLERKVIGCNDEFTRLVDLPKSSIIGSSIEDPKFDTLFSSPPYEDSGVQVDTLTYKDTLMDRMCLTLSDTFDTHSAIYVFFAHLDFFRPVKT